jgi:alginate O-acetyltransferase complex protein AlgI
MLLPQILLLAALALVLRAAAVWTSPVVRGWLIFAASVLALYWLQPVMPIRNMDFWFPTLTLALAVLGWLLTAPSEIRFTRPNALAAALLVGLVLLVALTRYVSGGEWFTATRPPPVGIVLINLGVLAAVLAGLSLILRRRSASGAVLIMAVVLLIVLLVLFKTPALALEAGRGLRGFNGAEPGPGDRSRHPLAGDLVHLLSPDPHPARPSDRAASGGGSANICQLHHLLPRRNCRAN